MRDALALGAMIAVIGVCSWYIRVTRPLTRERLFRIAERRRFERIGKGGD